MLPYTTIFAHKLQSLPFARHRYLLEQLEGGDGVRAERVSRVAELHHQRHAAEQVHVGVHHGELDEHGSGELVYPAVSLQLREQLSCLWPRAQQIGVVAAAVIGTQQPPVGRP